MSCTRVSSKSSCMCLFAASSCKKIMSSSLQPPADKSVGVVFVGSKKEKKRKERKAKQSKAKREDS